MKKLDKYMMKNLSFPDFEVEKMELHLDTKLLKIYVQGALLDINPTHKLGRGVLFFNNWEKIFIKKFDADLENWSEINIEKVEHLKDICEIKFLDSSVSLSGFSKNTGQWLEWKIINTNMYAEFN